MSEISMLWGALGAALILGLIAYENMRTRMDIMATVIRSQQAILETLIELNKPINNETGVSK